MAIKHLVSASDLNKTDIDEIMRRTKKFVDEGISPDLCRGKVVATLILQTSIRSMTSHQSGMIRAGGGWVGLAGEGIGKDAVLGKDEAWEDLVVTYGSYADCILMRHPENDAAERAAKVSLVPIINCGSGTRENATAGILLLAQMAAYAKKPFEGMKVGIYGTPGAKSGGGRCCTSLLPVFGHYGMDVFIDDLGGKFPIADHVVEKAKQNGMKSLTYDSFDNFIEDIDVLVLTKAGGSALTPELAEHVNKTYNPVGLSEMSKMKDDAMLMVITPRCGEVKDEVDSDPRSLHMKYAPYQEGALAVMTYLMGVDVE
jgi:aspartate carbamoyltransferase catalytic subunit